MNALRQIPLLFLLGAALASPGVCQPPRDEGLGRWLMESAHMTDGRTFRGLIQTEREGEVEFAEIAQPSGKPIYAIVRPLNRGEIRRLERLAPDQRRKLAERLKQVKQHARIEAGRMENLELERDSSGESAAWLYRGPWFTLRSTADENITRRAIVRVEQIFRAYRLLLPPRVADPSKPLVRVMDSQPAYRSYLESQNLDVHSPAFFAVRRNLVVAGADLQEIAQRVEAARAENERVRRLYEDLQSQFAQRLADLAEKLQKNGLSSQEINDELKIRRVLWQREQREMTERLQAAEKSNADALSAAMADMLAQLYHEAFHAYVENYVYPHEQYSLPRWLNEGLAQIFETGRLEADTLRIDAPHGRWLEDLQNDLRGSAPLPLAEILQGDGGVRLAGPRDNASRRRYRYAWGLAYYLVFEHDLLAGDRLDWYVSESAKRLAPIDRFERLVDQPLPQFERAWREYILNLGEVER